MSLMTLQIMHYGQEQSGGSRRNCIDFSMMATNNDISLCQGRTGWAVHFKGTRTGSWIVAHGAFRNIEMYRRTSKHLPT